VDLLGKILDGAAPGLLIAASFRSEAASASAPLARHLERAHTIWGSVARFDLDVGALSRAEAEALAGATLRALDVAGEGLVGRVATESAGIPFFVEELAHDVARHASEGPPSMVGVTLEGVLARRVKDLPASERALVEALSVANSPIPISVWFSVAGVEPGALRALWALRSSHFVRSNGASVDDRIELHHDRMRESVLRYMSEDQVVGYHLRLGRALAPRDGDAQSPWLFDAVRHLGAAAARLEGEERLRAARLHLAAGQRAKRAAAFPLAFDCFRAGIALLPANASDTSYDLALGLHSGAAEAAYLTASWAALDEHVAAVRDRGRTILDQLAAREVQIDAFIARRHYVPALDAGLEALERLDVHLPASPGEAEVGDAVKAAMASLARVGQAGLVGMRVAAEPTVVAAMRIQARVISAAYFARPALLPLIACRLVSTSVEHGLSAPTPYAVAVYGIVLNALGIFHEAHAWGMVALELLDRLPDRTLEARTRHVVHDLVCVFIVPLASTLPKLRAVIDIGKATGDVEYAAYAAHAYVHNAFYAGRPLPELHDEAVAFGSFMRGYDQVNALHVHTPFEHAIRCFLGRTRDPSHLGGESFSEAAALRIAHEAGSRSAEHIVRLLMGLVRFHFGDRREAVTHFEAGRAYLDGVASTWHVPMFHQYAALAIWSLPEADRAPHVEAAEASLAALRTFAEHGPANFAHRVDLVEGARAGATGDVDRARASLDRAAKGAAANGFNGDEGLAHELAAEILQDPGARAAACAAYRRWGAAAKVARLGG
jgi:predicted ATPase